MSDNKCQRLDAISGRDQMAENPPNQHAYEKFKRKAYQSVSVEEYLRKRNHDMKKKM